MASDKHLTWKTSFLSALASAKGISELHGLSFHVRHSRFWRYCTFFLPDFMAKIENPSVPDSRFEEFSVPFLDDFVGGDQGEFLLFPVEAFSKYLTWMERYRPSIEGLFISTGSCKKRMS